MNARRPGGDPSGAPRRGSTAVHRPASRSLRVLLPLAAALALTGCAAPRGPQDWDGLQRQQHAKLDQVYLRPGANFAVYHRVQLDPASVAFDRAWDPNASRSAAGRVTAEDMERIKSELAQMLRTGFEAELARGGYALTTASGDDVLRVTPQIVDLYVNAPDTLTAGRTRTYVMDAGRMTLVVEARDSVTGQLLARVVDTRQGTDIGRLQWANAVTNSAEARRAIERWAKVLREGLDGLAHAARAATATPR